MASHLISKSSFLKGLQCHKALYLYKNYYHLKDPVSPERQAVFNRGHQVGFLARKLFPGGIDVSPQKTAGFPESIQRTKDLLKTGNAVIYEPAFSFGGVLAALDIIVPSPAGQGWLAYEVKSSLKISHNYLLDAALQYRVIKNSGISIEDFFIVTLNADYVRENKLDVSKLFRKISVLKEVLKKQEFIAKNISDQIHVLNSGNMPDIKNGPHCFDPYRCDFMGTCWPSPLKEKHNEIPPFQNITVEKNLLNQFLKKIKYPVSCIDFEVMMPAIPLFDRTSPFRNLPFQFSAVTIPAVAETEINETLTPVTFIAEPDTDPRREFIENFLRHSEGEGSLLTYDQLMEKSILKALKKEFPEFAEAIEQRINRLVDLMIPFKNKWISNSKINKNYSLKNIACKFLEDPCFEKLSIANGRQAMLAYEGLINETDLFKMMEIKEALELYGRTEVLTIRKLFKRINELAD